MDIRDHNKRMLTEIAASGRCAGCPLSGSARVGMDASEGEAGHRTILIIGLNPGREEAALGLPFVGRAGRFLRECMARIGFEEAGGWAIINSILCSTNNESAIPDVTRCQRYCHANVAEYARMIRPKVMVPCGNGACGIFGLAGGITRNAKRAFVSRGPSGKATPTAVLPIIHPSSLIRNGGKSAPGYDEYMKRLDEIRQVASRFDPQVQGYNLDSWSHLYGERD